MKNADARVHTVVSKHQITHF